MSIWSFKLIDLVSLIYISQFTCMLVKARPKIGFKLQHGGNSEWVLQLQLKYQFINALHDHVEAIVRATLSGISHAFPKAY